MIDEILASDVEFAQGMVKSSRSDAEILSYLISRGIAADRAAQLIEDLRHDRKPAFVADYALGVPARSRSTTHAPWPGAPPPARARSHRRSRHTKRRRSDAAWWLAIILIIFLWAVWYAFFKTGADASKDLLEMERHALPEAPDKEPAR